MRKLLLFISAMIVWLGVFSQGTLPYNDDFESYTTGGWLAAQSPTWWTTWSGATGGYEDGQITTAFAHSGTKSVVVDEIPAAGTDQIMKLGNKVSGAYELKWWMYVETGYCGYYNIQHYQAPGTQWAFDVYLRTSGTGELMVGNLTYTFAYPKASWFEVKHLIDLDNDNIKLYINGLLIQEWPFHYTTLTTTGLNQLGGVDFYAGAKEGTTELPKYFFDDVSFSSYVPASDPIIGVAPTSLSSTLQTGQTQSQQLTVSNTGVADLTFTTNVILNSDAPGVTPVTIIERADQKSLSHGNYSADPNPQHGAGLPATDASAVLHYDGDNSSAIGWNSPPISVTVAARFPNTMTLPNAGMMLESVDVFINDINLTGSNLMTVKVYGMGTSYQPGPLLSSETFTPDSVSWRTITLSTPVLVTGEDLWIGYSLTQWDAGIFIPGTDAGPNDPNGNFLSTGVGWSHLSLAYNWNIRGNLNGTPFQQWMSVSPTSGTVIPNGNQVLDVSFNSTNLTVGTYTGLIRIWSNDPVTPSVDVPVTLEVAASVCPAPTGVAVNNITYSGANVVWSGAPQVEIDYAAGAHIAGTGTIITSYLSPQALTGLTALTSYQVYIRQVCGVGNYSPWAGPITFSTPEQYTTTLYPGTDGTGYVSNGSFLKKGPWMNTSSFLNDTLGRGYVKFDLSSLPSNAIITKATLNYYNFYRSSASTAMNWIFPLANDPVTTAGSALYSDCADGTVLWTGAWGGVAGTTPQWISSTFGADGFEYISGKISTGWAGFGIVRGAASIFRMTGYDDASFKPYLYVEYHVATTPVLSITPATKDFETVNVGMLSPPQTYTIKNAGTGSYTIDAIAIGGADPTQFVLTNTNPPGYVLASGASITVTVAFSPTSVGAKSATLSVTENDIVHEVPMTGTGYLNAPQNLTAAPVIGPYVNLAWTAPLPLTEIRYDNNSVGSNYYNGPNSTTSMYYYTKITIPANGTLTNIGVLTLPVSIPTTWQSISLCPDLGGVPNLAAPVQSFTSVPITTAGTQWVLQTLTPYPVTAGQTFYIVTQWPASASGAVAVSTDTHNNHLRCGSTQSSGAVWNFTNGNYLMRAYMTVSGDNSSNEPIILTSGEPVEGTQNVPLLVSGKEPKSNVGVSSASFMAPAIVMPAGSNKSLTNLTLHRGTVSGTWTENITVTGTTYQDVTTAPTTLYYYSVSADYSNGTAFSNIASVTTYEICPVPVSLIASAITTTSANLGWTPNGTTAWELEWGLAGFTQGTGTMVTSGVTNPYPISGLTYGTSYSFYVRSSCGAGSFSSWAGPYTFSTLCGMLPAPVSEDFELTTFPPACWSRTAAAATWERSTEASGYGVGEASALADFYNFDEGTKLDLMTMNFDATALYQPVLKFDYAYATYSAAYVDSMTVYYSTNAGATYFKLLAMPGGTTGILNTGGIAVNLFVPTAAQWGTQTLTLPAGTNMIKFTGISDYGNSMYLDNVKIEASVPVVPEFLEVTGTVVSGEPMCYDATNTITVGGTNTFTVPSGGSAIFIAGMKISYLPGTTVASGGYMHGYISTTYCGGKSPALPSTAAGQEELRLGLEQAYFTIFPNPTSGNFTIVQKGGKLYGNVTVEVYGMRGDRVLSTQMIGEKQHEVATSALPTGLYFVKVVADNYTETIKLIKTR